jgi:hypothetical protein
VAIDREGVKRLERGTNGVQRLEILAQTRLPKAPAAVYVGYAIHALALLSMARSDRSA